MLPPRVLADRNRLASYVTMMMVPAAMFTMFFFLTLILQDPRIMNESPMDTGLKFLPFSIVMIVWAGAVVSRLVQRVNPGVLAGIGATVAAVATFGLSRMPYDDRTGRLAADISYSTDILPYIILMPIGMGLVFIPMTMSVVHRVSPADSGIASGVLNTMQQVGGALGLATLATIALNATDAKAAEICRAVAAAGKQCDPADPALGAVSFVHGATVGFLWCSGFLLFGAVIAFAFNRIRYQDLASHEDIPVAGAH